MATTGTGRRGEMIQALFRILADMPTGLRGDEAVERVEKVLDLTSFEDSEYPNRPGVRRFPKQLRFATIGPVKAGWMVKRRGIWSITEEGIRALEVLPDPEDFMREAGRLYRRWRAQQPADPDRPEEIEPVLTSMLEEAEETARREIEEFIAVMNPHEFQDLVAGLLSAMQYYVQWVAPPGPDQGIDIVASSDPLGATPTRLKVQVKRRKDPTDVAGLRAFLAVLGDDDIGIFVSTGGFTRDADREARTQERRRITLVNLGQLVDLWVENYEQLEEEAQQLLPLRPVWYLAPRGL